MLNTCSLAIVLLCAGWCAAQDVVSGPEEGKKTPPLKVYAISGPVEKESLDYAARRGDKATIYVFVPHEKWSRPMHRFLLELGKTLPKAQKEALIVAVWLSDDVDKTKEYLPKISQYYEATALACYEGDKSGPAEWAINDRADVTIVLASRGNVIRCLGYNSVNETVAREVIEKFGK